MKLIHIGDNRYINPEYVVAIFPVAAHDETFDAGVNMYTLKVPHHVAIHIEHIGFPQRVDCGTFEDAKARAQLLMIEILGI